MCWRLLPQVRNASIRWRAQCSNRPAQHARCTHTHRQECWAGGSKEPGQRTTQVMHVPASLQLQQVSLLSVAGSGRIVPCYCTEEASLQFHTQHSHIELNAMPPTKPPSSRSKGRYHRSMAVVCWICCMAPSVFSSSLLAEVAPQQNWHVYDL